MSKLIAPRRLAFAAFYLALFLLSFLNRGDRTWPGSFSGILVVAGFMLLVWGVEASRHPRLLSLILLAVLAGSTAVYILSDLQQAAWIIVISWFSCLLLLCRQLLLARFSHQIFQWIWRVGIWSGSSIVAGFGLATFHALLTRFAEEEFFIASLGAFLSLLWLLAAISYRLLRPLPEPLSPRLNAPEWTLPATAVSLTLLALVLFPWLLNRYQRSFFPPAAPQYAAISEDSPFLCEEITRTPQTIPADEIKENLISLLEAFTEKDTVSWGSLALYSGRADDAAEFRLHLLQDAARNLYTSPAHSVKWGQFEAALRAHQLLLVDEAFPTLFSAADWETLTAWFGAINQRAMTVEWVDWLYAAAYDKRPEGPYENQEIGAGLLSLLMSHDLAAPELIEANRRYLQDVPLGWEAIFRNTDDAVFYQDIWLANAWWIHQYRQQIGEGSSSARRNMEQSALWLLLLGLPDGESLAYNLHVETSLAAAYLYGAALLHDAALSWAAGKTLQTLVDNGGIVARTFALGELDIPDGQTPDVGSCLIYGNSGVPTVKGPLGPDKVVLRDGWSEDAMYGLLNLRFTGWHRYKATNTIPLIYQDGPLVSERWTDERFSWLPVGRSAFRDKRVPREYLNGLLLPKTGLARVLWLISNIGSPWAQDPPAFAGVERFFTSSTLDFSATTTDWNGWHHERTVYLLHDGLILVMDQATNENATRPPSLIWHLNGRGGVRGENEVGLDNETRRATAVYPAADNQSITLKSLQPRDEYLRSPDWEMRYTSPESNQLKTGIAFLTREYTRGVFHADYVGDRDGIRINWNSGAKEITLLHNFSDGLVKVGGLETDGKMVTLIRDETEFRICYGGGSTIRVHVENGEMPLLIRNGERLLDPSQWEMEGNVLTIGLPDGTESGCLELQLP